MQDNEFGSEPIISPPMAASISLANRRGTFDSIPLSQSEVSLPHRRSHPSAASLYASTLTPPGSRPMSPVGTRSPGRPFPRATSGSVTVTQSLVDTDAATEPGNPLRLILKAFVPHVAIYASSDTDGLVAGKGFDQGLWELLRPFGERVLGKVTIRDSNGSSRPWDDFSVRFTRLGDHVEPPDGLLRSTSGQQAPAQAVSARRIAEVETVVHRHLSYAEQSFAGLVQPSTPTTPGLDLEATSPYYALYLRRLLSGIPLSAHESWAHPVACVIAVSSREPNPIETFRRLYHESTIGDRSLPPWVDGEYLRYYVLVHDEENSDVTDTMALFEQMKRHLGLHCHLLRIRSSQGVETDDDSIPFPRSEWLASREELADIERSEGRGGPQDLTRHIFESDATAIRTFVRAMVTQSIIPTMERNVSVWNDQVASKRKGLSGRFMSLSKRWTGFGSGSRNSTGSSSSNNYEAAAGYYRPEAPEAIMRRLADFAFMLRDWKLSLSTYELLRSDFSNDKAWKYHAAANEMAAVTLLIMPQNMSSKTRLDNITSLLEQSSYSYNSRCSSPYGTLRCMALGLELLRMRGGSAVNEAVKWGVRIMESRLVGQVGDALLKERMAVCCASKKGVGSLACGSWRRKSAFWSVLGAEAWIRQAKYIQAQRCLNEAREMYSRLESEDGIDGWPLASEHIARLDVKLKDGLVMDGLAGERAKGGEEAELLDYEEPELLNRNKHSSRKMSLAGSSGVGGGKLESAPFNRVAGAENLLDGEGKTTEADDGFS